MELTYTHTNIHTHIYLSLYIIFSILGDLWSFTTTDMWTDVSEKIPKRPPLPNLGLPPSRFNGVLCGVPNIILILHGGLSELGVPLSDTWLFDLVSKI